MRTLGTLFRLSNEDRLALALPFVGRRVDVVHAPSRGHPDGDRIYRGVLVTACRGPFHPSHLLVLRVETADRGAYDLAVPLSQVREVRVVAPRGALELAAPLPPTDETDETEEDDR